MRLSRIKDLLLFGIVFLGVFCSQLLKEVTACTETFSDEYGTFTLVVSSEVPVCDVDVSGPNGSVVLLSFTPTAEENAVILEISDQWTDNNTLLYRYNGGEVHPPTTNLYSFSSSVLLVLERNTTDFQLEVSYTIEDRSNLSTVLSNNSGEIDVTGDANNYINFQYMWHISAGKDNFLYFDIKNVTLNDAAGDYLAIGTGSELFSKAPALMLTGEWLNYPTIHLNGTEGYVYLFMKSYSPNMGIDLSYDTWLYTPPTLFPPFTKPPIQFIDAYFYFDDNNDNYRDVVTNFTKYVEKYAYQYCEREPSTSGKDHLPDYPLVLDVVVGQVVETNPCLVVEFYIDILNGTCLKDISFSNDDFRWLLGNYSDHLNSDFGRDVMTSCPMKLLWILAVAIIVFVAVLVIIFVIFKGKDMTSKYADGDNEREDDEQKPVLLMNPQRDGQSNHYATNHPEHYDNTSESYRTTSNNDGRLNDDLHIEATALNPVIHHGNNDDSDIELMASGNHTRTFNPPNSLRMARTLHSLYSEFPPTDHDGGIENLGYIQETDEPTYDDPAIYQSINGSSPSTSNRSVS